MRQQRLDWAPEKQGGDFIATPGFAVDALINSGLLPTGPLIDPFAGGGAILQRMIERGRRGPYFACEVRAAELFQLSFLPDDHIRIGDWYEVGKAWCPAPIIVTNVPFSDIPRAPLSLFVDDWYFVATLMPLEELGGVGRATWLNDYKPTALITFKRRLWPGTRGIAWYIWQRGIMPMAIKVI